MKKVHLISLGCAKNLVDSERFLASAINSFKLQHVDEIEQADLLLINTCAFLKSAVEEALECIMEAGGKKKEGAKLLVLGCLPARYRQKDGEDLASGLPEVDYWLSPENYHDFEKIIAQLLSLKNVKGKSFNSEGLPEGGRLMGKRLAATPFFRSYLKIAEGCDNHCTYCLIPRLRGPLKTYPTEALIAEAEALAEAGVKELSLVAQDLTAYGQDIKSGNASLSKLLSGLSKIKKLEWIRLLYAYPESLNESLVKDLANTPKVVPYLDLPFQHVSAEILKKMGRPSTQAPAHFVKKMREWWPGLALRTTLIVGFPGESEPHFQELLDFVNEAAFDHLGVFKFSQEPEAPASRMPQQVPQYLKEKRRRKIMAAQRVISLAHNRERLGRVFPVLVEGPGDEDGWVMAGRAAFQAPEVDGLIYFDGEQPQIGDIVNCRISKAAAYDLLGTLEEEQKV